MNYPTTYETKKLMCEYLLKGFTGCANDFAKVLLISRSTFFRYLKDLEELGAEIEYDRSTMHFQMVNDFNFCKKFYESVTK